MDLFSKQIASFAVSLIRPALDILIFVQTQLELQKTGWFYHVFCFVRKMNLLAHGRIEEPCWEKDRVYNVSQGKSLQVYVQKIDTGFWVWTMPSFLNQSKIFPRERMKPCFISIRYISNRGVEIDLDLEPEFYISGNELLSSGFVEWWIKTRKGVYWTNYSPTDSYTIVLMDNQLNVLELGPSDMVVVNKRGFPSGFNYMKFHYRLTDTPDWGDNSDSD